MRDPNFKSGNLQEIDKTDNSLIKKYKLNSEIDDDTKIELIEKNFREIMEVLGLDLDDDSLKDTPRRVAKMYVNETFSGLNEVNKPKISLFKNKYNYDRMIIEKNITLFSTCEHHFIPIIGKVHIGYYPAGQVLGLSKLNRIVQYYAKRPQQQEKLTVQIADEIMDILKIQDVAVLIEADHLCVKSRGVNDVNSMTVTSSYNGRFLNWEEREEFVRMTNGQ
ncbi:MAG TPA: GTP cyclohydrolase I FolE [Ignavibacteriaceae bacterium]|nr:GTP cyclohydrolase I FolE [Ignavibacteriaceae bacterium]